MAIPTRIHRGSVYNTCVEHGLRYRKHGQWFVPDYQRELVWTAQQKERFIESLFLDLPIGEYTVYCLPDSSYEVIDGQQRWNAIFSFVDDEFPVFGVKFSELSKSELLRFNMAQFPHRRIDTPMSYEDRVDLYNRLAYGGTPHERS